MRCIWILLKFLWMEEFIGYLNLWTIINALKYLRQVQETEFAEKMPVFAPNIIWAVFNFKL